MRVKKAPCHTIVRSVWMIGKILSPWKGCDSEGWSVVRWLKRQGRMRQSEAQCPCFLSEVPGPQAVIVDKTVRVPFRGWFFVSNLCCSCA